MPDASTIALEVMAAIDAADYIGAGALLDDSFELHYQGVPEPISKDTLLEMIRGYFLAFPDMRHEIHEVWPNGDHATMRVTVHATHRGAYEGVAATGRQVAVGGIHVFRTANGRIVEWWAAEDDLGLLRQIGMVIQPPESP